MALAIRRRRNPEGRMPLRAHLVELRNRLLVAAAAVLVGAVVGWYGYDWLLAQLVAPLQALEEEFGREASVNYQNVTTAFNQQILISLWTGVILASPMWIYQAWAFITPGLSKRERWYAVGFMAAAVPLFLAGIALAWLVLPNAITFLIAFAPDDAFSTSILPIESYLSFVTRVLLAFGIAFLTPVVMVALTMVGVVSGRTWVKGWRLAVVLCFVFAAIASPTPDIITMFALAGPMIALYMGAVVVTVVIDRRRRRRLGTLDTADVDDDEASDLDLDPTSVDDASPLDDEPGTAGGGRSGRASRDAADREHAGTAGVGYDAT